MKMCIIPVPLVMKEQLMEIFVDFSNGFEKVLRPAGKKLTDYLAQLDVICQRLSYRNKS